VKTTLINKKHVRDYLLNRAAETRPESNFSRVSDTLLRMINARVLHMLQDIVHRHPSNGQTLKEML